MQFINPKELQEAKEFMVHDVAPTLSPTLSGLFQVKLLGLYRNHAELQVNIVNKSREVLKGFGSNVVPAGGAVVIDNFSSVLNLAENAHPVTAFFQAWVIGIDKESTEAEISLRLVDEDRKELLNFGSITKKIGETIVLEGMDINVNVLSEKRIVL